MLKMERDNYLKIMGWTAIIAAALGEGTLIIFSKIRPLPSTLRPSSNIDVLVMSYKPVLNFQITMNAIGYAIGAVHGYILYSSVDYLSILIVVTMTIMLLSGILLRYSMRKQNIFKNHMHVQLALIVLLLILVCVHVVRVGI